MSGMDWVEKIERKRAALLLDTRELTDGKVRLSEALYDDESENDENDAPVALRDLHTLIVRGNKLRALDSRLLAPLKGLRWLDVSHNELERLLPMGGAGSHVLARPAPADPSAAAATGGPLYQQQLVSLGGLPPALEVVDASHNRIKRLSLGPTGPARLERLNVASNMIKFVASDLAKAGALVELDLRRNAIGAVDQLRCLAQARRLQRLLLANNPVVARDPRYKLKLAALSHHLLHAIDAPPLENASRP